MMAYWEGEKNKDVVQAVEDAEKLGRDVSARGNAYQQMLPYLRQLKVLLREDGEMPDDWYLRLGNVIEEEIAAGQQGVAKRNAIAFSKLAQLHRVIEPVSQVTVVPYLSMPTVVCDEETCLWDYYLIGYSPMLREAVILTVIRNLTKEEAEKCSHSK